MFVMIFAKIKFLHNMTACRERTAGMQIEVSPVLRHTVRGRNVTTSVHYGFYSIACHVWTTPKPTTCTDLTDLAAAVNPSTNTAIPVSLPR